MSTKRITLSNLERFIKNRLPKLLQEDLIQLRIVREADLASCVYFHLRSFLHADRTWGLFVERRSQYTGHFIDVILFREQSKAREKRQAPRIAIELKWNRNKISKKDRTSLDKCLDLMGMEKAYFISTLTGVNKYQRIEKTDAEKRRLLEIVVPLGLQGQALSEWKAARRLFTKDMSLGKRSKG